MDILWSLISHIVNILFTLFQPSLYIVAIERYSRQKLSIIMLSRGLIRSLNSSLRSKANIIHAKILHLATCNCIQNNTSPQVILHHFDTNTNNANLNFSDVSSSLHSSEYYSFSFETFLKHI